MSDNIQAKSDAVTNLGTSPLAFDELTLNSNVVLVGLGKTGFGQHGVFNYVDSVNGKGFPVELCPGQLTTLTPPAQISNFALESGGNVALIVSHAASLDTKTPALGQALAGASVPVVLPATQITALTPPAAITNYANESGGHLASLDTKVPAQVGGAIPVGLIAGSAKVGIVTTDQTAHGTSDLVAADITKVGGAAIALSNSGVPVDAAGTKVTAATIPAGGVGLLGWLSAIWYQLTQLLKVQITDGTIALTMGPQTPANSISCVPSTDQNPKFNEPQGTLTAVTTNVTILTPPAGCTFARIWCDGDIIVNTSNNAATLLAGGGIRLGAFQPETIPVVPAQIVQAISVSGSTANVRCTPMQVR